MQEAQDDAPDQANERPLVSRQTMEIVVALALTFLSALVIWDSTTHGFGWIEGQGPAPGFFPLLVAVLLGGSSLLILAQALFDRSSHNDEDFVSVPAFGRVASIVGPLLIYVAAIEFIGFYVASAIFIAAFMIILGRQGILKSLLIGSAVPVFLFFMFEMWFMVPLPKGPLEAYLGY